MARRRYISTAISTDLTVARLGKECGDFACLLYTWLIPHAEDDGVIHASVDELLLLVLPAFRWKEAEDVEVALSGMHRLELITWDREQNFIVFPDSFYRYQSYISAKRRKTAEEKTEQRITPQNTEQRRISAQDAAEERKTPLCSGSGLSSSSFSPSESEATAPQAISAGDMGDIAVMDVPAAMRETVDYFLLKTGRPGITPLELSAVRELEKNHVPARVNQEIVKAIERYGRNGKPLTELTLDYIRKSLQYQVSRKQKALTPDCAEPIEGLEIYNKHVITGDEKGVQTQ